MEFVKLLREILQEKEMEDLGEEGRRKKDLGFFLVF